MLIKSGSDIIGGYFQDHSGLLGGHAEKLYIPETEHELAAFLKDAAKQRMSVTISGAGTGVTGGRVPFGGVIVSLERLNKIGHICPLDNGTACVTVGAGALISDIKAEALKNGLMYAPDPTERSATIGGNIATNASGSRGFRFGSTRAYIHSLRVALANGDIAILKRGGYTAGMDNILSFSAVSGVNYSFRLPKYRLPLIKNAAGYFNEPGMDVIDIFIGHEGTLGVITQAELLLVPNLDAAFSAVAFFECARDAWQFARHARELSMAARASRDGISINALSIEYFDDNALQLLRSDYPNIPDNARSAIFFEQDMVKSGLDALLELWQELLKEHNAGAENVWFAQTPQAREGLRLFRHAIPEKVNEIVTRNGLPKVGTDIAVPEKHFDEMMASYETILSATGIQKVIFGHIGECHMHANILPANNEQYATARAAYAELVTKALSLGGTVSAEHGIGKTKHSFLEQMLGRRGINELSRIKSTLDPAFILNPGNIFPKP